jgi:membrane-associated phospholipid phosphatase
MKFLPINIIVSLAVVFSFNLKCNAQENADSTTTYKYTAEKFNYKQLIVPGALITVGALGLIDTHNGINTTVRDNMQDLSDGHKCHIDNYLRFLPAAAYLGLGAVGVKGKNTLTERTLVTATTLLSMTIMVDGLKLAVSEQRPDSTEHNSFPSGHVAVAFAGAEMMRIEYGTAYGISGYACATGIAFLRLYNNRHWLNDIIAGAGIGILSAHIGYLMLPLERKWLKISDKSKHQVAVMPSYNYYNRSIGISLSCIF